MRIGLTALSVALMIGTAPARAGDGVPLAAGIIGGLVLGAVAAAAEQPVAAPLHPGDILPIRRGTWVIDNPAMCASPQPGTFNVYNGRRLRSVFATCSLRDLGSMGSDHRVEMTCIGNGARKSREALIRVISDRRIVNASEGLVVGYSWCGP